MKKQILKAIKEKELKEIIQSGHINLLIGAGCSSEYLGTLGNIENEMNVGQTKDQARRTYYSVIKKSKAILDETQEKNPDEITHLANNKQNYDNFLNFWANTIASRSLHIVNKQVNIFTTNFDLFLEDSCERLNIPYNDGFNGQINRTFKTSNFNKILKYKSLQFDNTSDVPLFNIIKLHGSVSWLAQGKEIKYSDGKHIPDDLLGKTGQEFENGYKEIAVINPNAEKHLETVLHTSYASMLRKFTLELEKENSVLIIVGFSLNDKHIKELLDGVMRANPTLIVIYFSYSLYDHTIDRLEEKKYPNFYVISHVDKFSLDKVTEYFEKVFIHDEKPDCYDQVEVKNEKV